MLFVLYTERPIVISAKAEIQNSSDFLDSGSR